MFCHSDTDVAFPLLAIALVLGIVGRQAPDARPDAQPLLVVLAPTGETRDGLPVYVPHPDASAHEAALGRGFSGRLIRLFRYEQQFLSTRDGRPIEPAYLLLSTNQGGFPRFGFWLGDERKANVGYVDLHERSAISGQYGALDQIFPHELMHVIVQQLASPPPPGAGGANQVHAIGVRTDRVTAFHEGLAESAQVLAIDDPDGLPETRALASDDSARMRAAEYLSRYRRALEARWSIAPPSRLGFVLWFSQTEQALRYQAVARNAFAREPSLPARLLGADDLYPAYLLENVLPGAEGAPLKSTPRLLATEGVVSALFARWVREPALQQPVADLALYDRFGVRPDEPAPIDHAYLKLFVVLADRRPHDAASLVRGYVETFPGETEAVARLLRAAGFDWPLPDVPEIWLANDGLMTGTTLFDQYRAIPRVHTFDLNAASPVDLIAVDGVSPELAQAITRASPYASLADLARVPGVGEGLTRRFEAMVAAMVAVGDANAAGDIESIDLMRIFRPVLVRAVLWILVAAAAAGWLYRRVRETTLWRAALNGLSASAVGLLFAWVLGAALQVGGRPAEPALLVFMPLAFFGIPGALWQIGWRRSRREAGRVLAGWALACVPALALTQPLF